MNDYLTGNIHTPNISADNAVNRNIISNALFTSIGRYSMLFLRFLRNIILARILGIEDYNIWVIFLVFVTYLDLMHFGLRQSGDRDLPILNGTGRFDESLHYSKVLLSGIIILSTVCSLALLLLSYLLVHRSFSFLAYSTSSIAAGLYFSAFVVLGDQLSRYCIMLLRTKHRFKESTAIELTFDLLSTVLSCVLGYYYSISGAIAGYTIGSLSLALYFFWFGKDINKSPYFRLREFTASTATGIPLFIANLLLIFSLSIDRLSATLILTKHEMSVFGFASQFAALPILAISGLRDVLYPSFGELSSSRQLDQSTYALYTKSVTVTIYVAALFAICILLAGDVLVRFFVPEFAQSLFIMHILSGAMMLIAVTSIPVSILFIYKKHWHFCLVVIRSVIASSLIFVAVQYIQHQHISSLLISFWFFSLVFSYHVLRSANKSLQGESQSPIHLFAKATALSFIFPVSYLLSRYALSFTATGALSGLFMQLAFKLFLFVGILSIFLAVNKTDLLSIKDSFRKYRPTGKSL